MFACYLRKYMEEMSYPWCGVSDQISNNLGIQGKALIFRTTTFVTVLRTNGQGEYRPSCRILELFEEGFRCRLGLIICLVC